MGWEHFRHGADVGVRGVGATRGEAFEQIALALTAVVTEPAQIRGDARVDIHCEAPDDDLLIVDWLNALILEMSTRRMVFGRFDVATNAHAIDAVAWGEPLDRIRHQPSVEVKSATYTELMMRQRDDGTWIAQCVVDV